SWDAGVINNVVAWFEVLEINFAKSELAGFFEKADFKLDETASKIAMADSTASGRLNECVVSLNTLKEKFLTIQEYSVQSVSSAGAFDNLRGKILSINEKYNNVDFDKLSKEEKEDYYNRLNSIPDDQLTEEDKARIQKYVDYLEDKFVVDGTISDEEKYFIDLYEKLHEEEKEAINTFFDNSNKDNGFTDVEKAEIKYITYTSEEPYHELFFDCIAEFSVADFNAMNEDDEGNKSPGCWFSPSNRKIYLNRNSNGATSFIDDPFGSYNALFQEIGHSIDDLIYNGNQDDLKNDTMEIMLTGSSEYKEKLYSAMYKDVENAFIKSIKNYNNNEAWVPIDENGQKKILDVLMGRKKYDDLGWNARLKFAYSKIYEDFTGRWKFGVSGTWNGSETGILENISGGASASDTFDAITGSSTSRAGHGADYWVDDGVNNYMSNTEVFSQYVANGMTNKHQDNISRQLLPETYKVLDEMVEKKLEEIRNRPSD
ncbi:MAG: hypothetical protein NC548_40930, partial [Lachnospiraceae bacterium]|nr:hypothetical protein [Lachnospiraceae bacterium]